MSKKPSPFSSFLENSLNASQKKAVTNKKGSLLVIAGAGSGKTRVITARIAHLILNENVAPSSIVALTFTNKAAKEMRERVAHFLGSHKDLPFVGTFHSYCLSLLKQNPKLLRTPFLSILDEDDQQRILKGIIDRNHLSKKITAKQAGYQISQIKNQLAGPEDMPYNNPLMDQIFAAYEAEKKASKCLDFDDLLIEAVHLFKKHKDFKKAFHQSVRHILVDEYQDTNVVQHELLKHMASDGKNSLAIDSLCVVGDEDQSIYSWRGATVTNIINFHHDFPDTQLIKIEQNYRSVQPMLEVANHVIAHNKNRNPKNLWSDRAGSHRIQSITCLSDTQEAEAVAHLIKVTVKAAPATSIAILYRAHYQSRSLEEALVHYAIPYKIIGGVQFYERKEIKDMLAYLRLVLNPFDRPSFFRVINVPARGLGAAFEDQFYTRWHAEPFLTFTQVAEKLIEEGTVTGTKKTALKQFVGLFAGLTAQDSPSKILEHFLKATSYNDSLAKAYDEQEARERNENIKELANAISYGEQQGTTPTLIAFLEEVALMQEKNTREEHQNPVLLMTLHAAKGLEFDTVIITGLEEALLPTSRSLVDENSLEEERRLFYVGITRAKERLLLTHCRYRYTYGQMNDQRGSRFLDNVPAHLVPHQDCSYWQQAQFSSFFNNWLGVIKPTQSSVVHTFGPALPSAPAAQAPISRQLPFKTNQPVKHARFGIGIVQQVEQKINDSVTVTVKFKTGTKKIAAHFLEAA